jgi:endonuclease/exonuclease/phosphatase family metal-dependent hydrolase
MTKQEQQAVASKVNGLIGRGKLNWMGDFNMESKKEQFNIFFNKETQAKKALDILKNYGAVKIVRTPKFINSYFKFAITVTL